MKTETVLGRGYFPKELPPPFTTRPFAAAATPAKLELLGKPPTTVSARHNLARVGSLRRSLSIPNPLSQHILTEFVCSEWKPLHAAASHTSFSLSRPKEVPGKRRAIEPAHPFSDWPLARLAARAGKRFLLRADISFFYASIYTHSIPWALHTKAVAKARHGDPNLLGNRLDKFLRDGNQKQTVGIPIGPDTSLLVAELVLAAVDVAFGVGRLSCGSRFLDDYELAFATRADAEQALADLQGALSEYELALNPAKCAIEDLPRPLEALWVASLRHQRIAQDGGKQQGDLISYFTRAFVVARENPQDAVLKYALGRTATTEVEPQNWGVYQSLLLQTASGEPGTLPRVLNELAKYSSRGATLENDLVASVLSAIVAVHAPMAHGSEVAWALWGAMLLGVTLDQAAESSLARMTDPTVALLALDATRRGSLSPNLDISRWDAAIAMPEAGLGSNWLLAYEAAVKGWLPSASMASFGDARAYFEALAKDKVSFYDRDALVVSPPSAPSERVPPELGGPFEGEFSQSEWEDYCKWKAEQAEEAGDDDAESAEEY